MQVNAISNQNFKGATVAAEGNHQYPLNPGFNQQMQVLDKIVGKVNSDVHPSTIVATVGAVLATAMAVRKLTPVARRFAVKSGEVIATGATKAFTGIVNKFKKNKIDSQKALEAISNGSKKLINGSNEIIDGAENSKIISKIGDFVDTVLAKEKGTTQEVLNKIGIKDGISLFDAGVAVAAGALTLDPVSDKVEERNDQKDIIDAFSELLN